MAAGREPPPWWSMRDGCFDATTREQAQEAGIEWQLWAGSQSLSMGELLDWQGHLEDLARKFDLTDEFRENGVI